MIQLGLPADVVTGGGSGLGAVMARRLVREGRPGGAGRAAVRRRRGRGRRARGPGPGGGAATSLPRHDVAALGRRLADDDVSILVNNAGIGGPVAELPDITAEEWDEVFAINVRGTFLMCRALLPAMYERGAGDVVNVASVSGKRPLARRTPYCASKMAVIGLTSTLAHEAGPHGVRVNTLSPGPVESERMERNFRLEAERTGSIGRRGRTRVRGAGRTRSHGHARGGRRTRSSRCSRMPGLTGSDVDLSGGMIA